MLNIASLCPKYNILGPIPETIRSLWKLIGSLISRQFAISRSGRIPRTVLLRSDHDPGDPARYVDWCWIRYFIRSIGRFISNITLPKIHKLPGNIYWNMICLVSTACIFTYTYIIHTHACQIWHVRTVLYREQTLIACTEVAMTLSYRHL